MAEPMLIGDIIRQMIEETPRKSLLTEPRIKMLVDDYGVSGLGVYVLLRNLIEVQSSAGLPLGLVINFGCRYVGRNKLNRIIRDYDLFAEDEFGFMHVCDLDLTHTECAHGTCTRNAQTECAHGRNTPQDNINKNKNININKTTESVGESRSRFVKPTVEEVQAYCIERSNGIDATRFWTFYESKGCMVGKNRMKNWQAAVRSWEQQDKRDAQRRKPIAERLDAVSNVAGPLSEEAPKPTVVNIQSGIQYYNGRPLPPDAPLRPSDSAEWDESSQSWLIF